MPSMQYKNQVDSMDESRATVLQKNGYTDAISTSSLATQSIFYFKRTANKLISVVSPDLCNKQANRLDQYTHVATVLLSLLVELLFALPFLGPSL